MMALRIGYDLVATPADLYSISFSREEK